MPSKVPTCPWCAKPMTYVRTTPGAGVDRRHHHYECKRCIVVYTELDHGGDLAAERARKLNKEPIRTLQ